LVARENRYREADEKDGPVSITQTAEESEGRKAPDQNPGGPVERFREFRGVVNADPPIPIQIGRRNLKISCEIEAEPQKRFADRVFLVEERESEAAANEDQEQQAAGVEAEHDEVAYGMGGGPIVCQSP